MVRRVRRLTSYRQAFWKWMDGPGLKFRDPRPDGTNYMGAYDLKTGRHALASGTGKGTGPTRRRRRDGLDDDDNKFRRSSNEALNQAAEGHEQIDDGARDDIGGPENENPLSADPGAASTGDVGGNKPGLDGGDAADVGANLAHTTTGNASAVMRFPQGYDTSMYPFPLNAYFRSQPVLSEEFRKEIYERVVDRGWSVREVSAAMGVSMERVGAVVRLGEVEKRWQKEGKPLATVYARAVLSMLPKTPYKPLRDSAFSQQQQQQSHKSNSSASSSSSGPSSMAVGSNLSHEPINDLPVHASTRQQLFHPVAESAHFTRADAAHVFSRHLLPADARIPHPELIALERDRLSGVDRKERDAKLKERGDLLDEISRRRLGRSLPPNNNSSNNNKNEPPSPLPASNNITATTAAKPTSPSLNPPNLLARIHSSRSLKVIPARRWTFMVQDVTVDADAGERHGQLIQGRKLRAGKGGRVGGKDKYFVGERGLGAPVGTPGMNAGIDFNIARGIGNPAIATGTGPGTGPRNGGGQTGRVGWRYGVPHNDRKKGVSKIAAFVD